MSIQLASTDVIQVLLDAAPATNQLPVNVSYVDQGGSGNNLPSITSGTTPVTIVGSPASGVERLVSHISIPNADTATRTVTVNLVRSSVASRLCKITLQAGYALYYDGKWMVLDPNGNFLCDVTVTGGTLTSNQGAPAAIANAWPVEVTDGTNVLGTSTHPIRIDPTGTTTQPVSVTNFPGVQVVNLTQVASSTLTSPSNYGTAPTGTVIGVNAFITNTPSVSQSGSWTVTSNQGTSPWTIQGDSASGATNAGNPVKIGGAFNTTQPTVTNGQTVDAQMTSRGAQIVATGTDTFNVTVNASLPTGSNTIGAVTQASGPWTVSLLGVVNAANSSTSPLGSNASFTGTSVSVLGYSSIEVMVYSDQASATNGVLVEFSTDGTNWDDASTFSFSPGSVGPNQGNTFVVGVRGQFARVVYTNGSVAQTTFRLQTVLKVGSIEADILPSNASFSGNNHAILTIGNIAQIGGSSVSLGQKTSANSLPVVIASDDILMTVPSNMVLSSSFAGTTSLHTFVATATLNKLRLYKIDLIGYTNTAACTITLTDGSGATMFNFLLPAISTATTAFNAFFSDKLAQTANNASAGFGVQLSSSPTAGVINIQVGASN